MKTYLFKFNAKAVILCLLLISSSCEKDDLAFTDISQNVQSNSVSFEVVSKAQLPQHKTLSKTLEVFEPTTGNNKSVVFSNTYGFAIYTENTLLNIQDSLKTYTFKVLRPQQNPHILENLVVSIDTIANTTQQLLISYPKLASGYDFQYMTVTELSEHIAIPFRTFGCYEVWVQEDPTTIDFPCNADGSGNGHHMPGDNCSADPQDQPYSITVPGDWVLVQECPNGSDQLIYGDCTGCSSNTGGFGGGSGGLNTLPFDPVDVKTLQFNTFIEHNFTQAEQNWLNSIHGFSTRFEMKQFLENNLYDDTSKNFVLPVPNAVMNNGEVDFDDRVLYSPSVISNPKARCIFQKLSGLTDSFYKTTLNELFGGDKEANIVFRLLDTRCAL